jgi:hypothetical protein
LSVASVYEGTVGSGTKLVEIWGGGQAFGAGYPITAGTGIFEYNSTTAGNVTFNVGLRRGAGVGTAQMDGAQNAPCILVVELV